MKTLSRLLVLMSCLLTVGFRANTQPATRPTLPTGIVAERDVNYAGAIGRSQTLDIFYPAKADAPAPLIIWVHGGGWSGGDKRDNPALGMLKLGYAVASLNYRFSQEAIYPAQIQDCKGAIRWLRANAQKYNINPKRFGVWGASAGGHLVALLGTGGDAKELEGDIGGNLGQSSSVQCVCDWFGPTDMSVFFKEAAEIPNIFKADPNGSPIAKLFGGQVSEHLDLVKLANPITFVKKENPPFLIVHGDKDAIVPLAQSEILTEALKKAGVDVHLEVLVGAGHGNGFDKPALREMMVSFFNKNLKNAEK